MAAIRANLAVWRLRGGLVLALVLACLVLTSSESLAQCRMCATALNSPEGEAMAEDLNKGILFLLAVPMTAIGTIGWLVARRWKRPDDPGPDDEKAKQQESVRAA